MAIDSAKDMYAKFTVFPQLSYLTIKYLMDNNELIWKLLKYNDPDAWKPDAGHPALTQSEKGQLIYPGGIDLANYRVFMDSGQDDAFTEEICVLRISPMEAKPDNHIVAQVIMGFEVYAHYKVNTLSNYTTRIDLILQQIVETINGADVAGLGRMYFDDRCRLVTLGQTPMKGKALSMYNHI